LIALAYANDIINDNYYAADMQHNRCNRLSAAKLKVCCGEVAAKKMFVRIYEKTINGQKKEERWL